MNKRIMIFMLFFIYSYNFSLTAQYVVKRSILGSGGSNNSNSYYSVKSTVGDFVIENASNSIFSLKSGFWMVEKIITNSDNDCLNIISAYRLIQNYPNPFNPLTYISFILPKPEHVTLDVFNTLGQKIETLLDQKVNFGVHDVTFDATALPSGIYFYRIQAGEFNQVRKMVLLR